jgi:hypothetical protein
MMVLLLGAGFSRWAAQLPVVSGLFDLAVEPFNQRDRQRLSAFAQFKARRDEMSPGTHPEAFVRAALQSPFARLTQWYITRRLSEPFVASITRGFQSLMIDDRRKWNVEGVCLARAFVERCRLAGLGGIVTCNYDLLVEYALGSDGFTYGERNAELKGRGKNWLFPWQGRPVVLRGNVPIAKLHGSVSWDAEHAYTDGRCGLRGDALIVPPTPEKEMPPPLQPAWTLAERILSGASHVCVFGFAFNPYDQTVLNLLRHTASRTARVLLVDPLPNTAAAAQIWKSADITTIAPQDALAFPLAEWGE